MTAVNNMPKWYEDSRRSQGGTKTADGVKVVRRQQTESRWYEDSRRSQGGTMTADGVKAVRRQQTESRWYEDSRRSQGGTKTADGVRCHELSRNWSTVSQTVAIVWLLFMMPAVMGSVQGLAGLVFVQ